MVEQEVVVLTQRAGTTLTLSGAPCGSDSLTPCADRSQSGVVNGTPSLHAVAGWTGLPRTFAIIELKIELFGTAVTIEGQRVVFYSVSLCACLSSTERLVFLSRIKTRGWKIWNAIWEEENRVGFGGIVTALYNVLFQFCVLRAFLWVPSLLSLRVWDRFWTAVALAYVVMFLNMRSLTPCLVWPHFEWQ